MAEVDKLVCTCCGKEKLFKDYYQSQSNLYKYYKKIPICKSCIDGIYNKYKNKYKDERVTIYNFCRLLDLPYGDSDYNGAVQHSEKTGWKIYQSYFKQINSFGDVNNVGACFEDGEGLIDNDRSANKEYIDIETYNKSSEFKITPDILSFWGNGFQEDEYLFLTDEYHQYTTAYECDSPAMEKLLQQAAYESLEIRRKRERRESVDKHLKNLQDLLGSANIKPVQETGANATDQTTFGTLIKKWENEKPIPDPLPEWKEKDVFQYMKVWFLGHLSKMIGLNNPFDKEYEEEVNKHTVDIPFEEDDESGE